MGELTLVPQRVACPVRLSLMQGTGGPILAFQNSTPFASGVAICERPELVLSWCHFGHTEVPYWGGGGGGGGAVKVMLSTTVAWPAVPAPISSVEVRVSANAWAATETAANWLLPPLSEPAAGATATAASEEDPVQESATPPALEMEMLCAGGAAGTSAVKLSTSGVTASCAGGGGGGGAAVNVMSSVTVALPAVPAAKVACETRWPAAACAATETSTVATAPGASVPAVVPSVTWASSPLPVQLSDVPPVLRSCTCWLAGAPGTCAVNVNANGVTTSTPGGAGGGGGASVAPRSTTVVGLLTLSLLTAISWPETSRAVAATGSKWVVKPLLSPGRRLNATSPSALSASSVPGPR